MAGAMVSTALTDLCEVPGAAEDEAEAGGLLANVNAEEDVAVRTGPLDLDHEPVTLGALALEPHSQVPQVEGARGQVSVDDSSGPVRVGDRGSCC